MKYFADFKVANQWSAKRMEGEHRAAMPPSYHSRDLEGYEASIPDDEKVHIQSVIQESLNN